MAVRQNNSRNSMPRCQFEVIGCHSGKKYRILQRAWINVHEIDGADNSIVCCWFLPDATQYLASGDVMRTWGVGGCKQISSRGPKPAIC